MLLDIIRWPSKQNLCDLMFVATAASVAANACWSIDQFNLYAIPSIANQLVRLVGATSTLRPVLEALYHRMLLYPPVAHRIEPLRSVRELLQVKKIETYLAGMYLRCITTVVVYWTYSVKCYFCHLQNPKRLKQLVLLRNGESGQEGHSDDMAIIRL